MNKGKTSFTIYITQHRVDVIAKELFNVTTMQRKEQIEEDEFMAQRKVLLTEKTRFKKASEVQNIGLRNGSSSLSWLLISVCSAGIGSFTEISPTKRLSLKP